jgi:surfeit locus 1 family protein
MRVMAAGRVTGSARGLIGPALVALAAFSVLIALGAWQLERRTWKHNLIAILEARTAAAPMPLPARESWPQLDPAEMEFRRVRFPAEFLHDKEALVYTSGSALRRDASGPGYWVFTPARLSDGRLVVVNRGFVPQDRQDPQTRTAGQFAGAVEVVGALRGPEARGWFTPDDDLTRNLWFVRDHIAMAAAKGWGTVAPFYVEQEAPPAPGGLPQVGPIQPNLPDNHLQYAVTWFGLAAVLLAVFIVWMRSARSGDEKKL